MMLIKKTHNFLKSRMHKIPPMNHNSFIIYLYNILSFRQHEHYGQRKFAEKRFFNPYCLLTATRQAAPRRSCRVVLCSSISYLVSFIYYFGGIVY